MTQRELHVRDLAAGRAVLVGTRLVLRAPLGPSPVRSEPRAPALPPKRSRDPRDQRRRQSNGEIGEAVAEVLHDVCRRAGVADVTKIATPMQICGRDPADARFYRAVFAKKVGVDFRGHMADGRAVYSEVKFLEHDAARYPLSHLRPAQRAQLDAAHAARAVAVLVVVRGPRREVFALPWSVAREHVALGDRELAPWKVRAGIPYLSHFARRSR